MATRARSGTTRPHTSQGLMNRSPAVPYYEMMLSLGKRPASSISSPGNGGSTSQTRRRPSNGRRARSASTVEDLYGRFFSSNGVAAGGSPGVSLPGIRNHRRHMRPGRAAEAEAEAAGAAADVAARAAADAGEGAAVAAPSEDGAGVGEGGGVGEAGDSTARTSTTTTAAANNNTTTTSNNSNNTTTTHVRRSGASNTPGSATRRRSLQRLAETSDADAGSTPAVYAVDDHHADLDAEFEKMCEENERLKVENAEKDALIAAQAKELAELRSALAAAALGAPSLEASRPSTAVKAVKEEEGGGGGDVTSTAAASLDGTDEEHLAATRIQASYRGHRARKDGGNNTTDKPSDTTTADEGIGGNGAGEAIAA